MYKVCIFFVSFEEIYDLFRPIKSGIASDSGTGMTGWHVESMSSQGVAHCNRYGVILGSFELARGVILGNVLVRDTLKSRHAIMQTLSILNDRILVDSRLLLHYLQFMVRQKLSHGAMNVPAFDVT
jgi:hypothetical protein